MTWIRVLEQCVKCAVIGFVAVSLYFQHYIGLADNGDYERSLQPFSTGPVGMSGQRPAPDSEAWTLRYGSYWIPYWEYRPSWSRLRSTAALLWIPGAALNYLFFSDRILYAPALGLLPRALLVFGVFLVFRWIDESERRHRLALYLALAAPFALMISCRDYLAYLNTFYQETASFIFALVLLASFVLLKRNPSSKRLFLLGVLSVILLAGAKCSTVYMPVLAVPVLYYCRFSGESARQVVLHYLRSGILLTAGIAAAAIYFTYQPEILNYNRYNSLFDGVLTFSKNPQARLSELGLGDYAACVGHSAYSPEGSKFIGPHLDRLSHLNTLHVLWREPTIVLSAAAHAAGNMQDIGLDYLGQYALSDPRSQIEGGIAPVCEVRSETAPRWAANNLWAGLKFRFFPVGYTFFLACLFYVVFFAFGLRGEGIGGELSIIGLFAAVACAADMLVAILGDGRSELVKHLSLSNLLFDIATIACASVALLATTQATSRHALKEKAQQSVCTRFRTINDKPR